MGFSDVNQTPQDIYLDYGNDFLLSPTNDLLLTDGSTLSNQRIQRRLMTNPLDYVWVPSFGAGLPNFIGEPATDDNYGNIQARITSNIFLEQTVSQTPPPEILLQSIQFGLFCQINYNLNPNQQPVVMTLSVGQT